MHTIKNIAYSESDDKEEYILLLFYREKKPWIESFLKRKNRKTP